MGRNSENLIPRRLAAGLDESLYPALRKSSGIQDTYITARVIELLKQLLNCIPLVSVPADSHDSYQRHLMPIDTLNIRKAGL
jgi:hypothetical protein